MALDLTNLVPIYADAIDDIINQMGKSCELHFKDTVTGVNSTFVDKVRSADTRMPDYKEQSTPPTVSENTEIITALVKYNPSDYRNFGLRIDKPEGIVRLKTFLTDVPSILRCEFMIPNVNSKGFVNTKYQLLREPIPIGLKIDRYAISFWARI